MLFTGAQGQVVEVQGVPFELDFEDEFYLPDIHVDHSYNVKQEHSESEAGPSSKQVERQISCSPSATQQQEVSTLPPSAASAQPTQGAKDRPRHGTGRHREAIGPDMLAVQEDIRDYVRGMAESHQQIADVLSRIPEALGDIVAAITVFSNSMHR